MAQRVKERLKNEITVKVEFDKKGFVDRMAKRLKDDEDFRRNVATFCAGMVQTMLDTAYGDFPNTASMANIFRVADFANCCCSKENTCLDD